MSDSRRKSLPTHSSGHHEFNFNGVFREVHSMPARNRLYKAQTLVAERKWKDAEDLLKLALEEPTCDEHDVRNLKLILAEVEMYQARSIPDGTKPADNIPWDEIHKRNVAKHFERFVDLPQSVFMLKSNKTDRVIVGRRVLSHQYVDNKIRELHCSHVTPEMFFGVLVDQRIKEDGYIVFYKALTPEEKLGLMKNILASGIEEYELTFPFPALIGDKKEEIESPEEGWEIDEKLALSLGEGEVYIRDFTVRFLKALGRNDLRLFDCACSTGQFLYTMKQGVPGCFTIGSDLSAHMVEFATKRVDEIYCANALEPKIPQRSVDVVFIRFINSEVVKTEIAPIFLKPLSECLKKGGLMIILGHTPILTSAAEIKMLVPNMEILQSIGGDSEWNGIFQYYVCKRTD